MEDGRSGAEGRRSGKGNGCMAFGLHTNFPGANLGHGHALNSGELRSTASTSIVFPAVSLFPQAEGLCAPHWQ